MRLVDFVQRPRAFIYGLVDPRTQMIHYVGQTSGSISSKTRPEKHATPSGLRNNQPKSRWIRELLENNLTYDVVVLEVVDDPQERSSTSPFPARNMTCLNEAEEFWITYGDLSGWPLTNVDRTAKGGPRGWSPSAAARAAISRALTGRRGTPWSEQHRQRQREALERNPRRGRPAWNKGLTPTPATRAKIANTLRGRKASDVTRAKLSAVRSGSRHWQYGKSPKDATKKKISESLRGRRASPETRAKMSIAQRERRIRER